MKRKRKKQRKCYALKIKRYHKKNSKEKEKKIELLDKVKSKIFFDFFPQKNFLFYCLLLFFIFKIFFFLRF